MSSCSYIALLINRDRGAHNNEKDKTIISERMVT